MSLSPRTRGLAVLLVGLALALPARAAKPQPLAPSLRLVPADAAFYSVSLRLGDQWEAAANSQAWAKLKALPAVQTLRKLAEAQLADPKFAEALKIYQQPEN